MTVSNTNNTMKYTGGGGTTLPYTFQIFAAGDLVVTQIITATGISTTLGLNSGYTVDGVGSGSGGNVYLTVDPGSAYTIVIQRVLGLTQGIHYVPNDPFPSTSHEQALDRLTMITQQLQEQINRCIKLNLLSAGNITFPTPQAGMLLAWADNVGNIGNVPVPSLAVGVSFVFGSENTDGSWKMIVVGNNLLIQRRESGSWVTKGDFEP